MKNALRLVLGLLLGATGALSVLPTVQVAHADPNSRPGVVAERPRDAGVHAVDGEVRTVAQVGGSVVMGGNFTKVGPVTRGAVGIVDTASKTFAPGFPDVVGSVSVAVSDGAGGWYLGGSFSSVGGVARANLAQVNSAGAVTGFAPSPNGAVLDLATTADGDLVAGGAFTTMAGQTARGVARLGPGGGRGLGRQRHRRFGARARPLPRRGHGLRRRRLRAGRWHGLPQAGRPGHPHRCPQDDLRGRHPQPARQRHRGAEHRRGADRRLVHHGRRDRPGAAGRPRRRHRGAGADQREHQQHRQRPRARRRRQRGLPGRDVRQRGRVRCATGSPA